MELELRLLRPIFFFLIILQHSSSARILTISKPDRHDYAASARWLVSQNIWGVLRYLQDTYFAYEVCNSKNFVFFKGEVVLGILVD